MRQVIFGVAVILFVLGAGCVTKQDGKIIIDLSSSQETDTTPMEEIQTSPNYKFTSTKTVQDVCEENIRTDRKIKSNVEQFPNKITHIDIALVNNSKDANNRARNFGALYDRWLFNIDYPDEPTYFGIVVVEITGGQFSGTRGYFYYGCDLNGTIITYTTRLVG